jgi:hypothetical protein
VSNPFGLHRVDETEIIHVSGHFGKQFTDPSTALPILLELPERLHDPLRGTTLAGIGDGASVVEAEHFAIFTVEQGFVIESIDLAGTTLHENEDDPFSAWSKMRGFWGKRVNKGSTFPCSEPCQSEITKAASQRLEGIASGKNGTVGLQHVFLHVVH